MKNIILTVALVFAVFASIAVFHLRSETTVLKSKIEILESYQQSHNTRLNMLECPGLVDRSYKDDWKRPSQRIKTIKKGGKKK